MFNNMFSVRREQTIKMTIIRNKQLNKSLTILKWLILHSTACPVAQRQYIQITVYWLQKIDELASRQGIQWTCDHFKNVRALSIAYLSGNGKTSAKRFIRLTSEGIPAILGPLIPLLRSKDETDIKILLTLLKVTKTLRTAPRPDVTPITNDPTGSLSILPEEALQAFFDSVNIERGSLIPQWSEYHLSTRSSPIKGPATEAALRELELMKNQPQLLEAICVFGGETIRHYIEILTQVNLPKPEIESCLHRLVPISDKEGKTRVVAIINYWSQTVLKPFHDNILSLLSHFSGDMTFNQESFTDGKMKGPYYCYDLKDATDRFPISLQRQVVEYVTSEEHSEAWAHMLVHYPYEFNGKQVLYKTGQPMGAYSSWAIFSLTHHLIVHYAARNVGIRNFRAYWLLGDDIVIRNREVALEYQRIMLLLGVEFSSTKTIISDHFCEFASRHFIDGREVTGFSCNGLMELNSIPELVEFFRTMVRHGWHIPHGNPPDLIKSLAKVLHLKHSFTREQLQVLWLFPLREALTCNTTLEKASMLSYLSCFNYGGKLLRDSLLLILEEKLENELEFVVDKSVTWARALSHICLSLTQDLGTDSPPLSPNVVPLIGAFNSLRNLTKTRQRELFQLRRDSEPNNLEWVTKVQMLHTLPDVSQAMRGRGSVLILRSNASLILKAWKHAKRVRAEM